MNGSWTGIVGLVNRSEADIAIGTLSITADRSEGIDYTIPYFYDPLTYMLSADYAYVDRKFSLKDSDLIAYGLIMLAWFLMSVMIAKSIVTISIVSNGRFCGLWNFYKNFLQRGLDTTEEPHELSLRSLTITWLIAGIVSNAVASGALVAALAPSPANPIDSFETLATSYIRPTIPKGGVIYIEMLRNSKNLDIQRMTRRLLITDLKSTFEGIQALVGQPHALIQASSTVSCGRKKLNERIFYLPPSSAENTFLLDFYGIGLRRPSDLLKPAFDDVIYRLIEGYIIKSWQIQSENAVSNNREPFALVEKSLESSVKSISLIEIELLIYLICFGTIMASVVLMHEIIKFRKVVKKCRPMRVNRR